MRVLFASGFVITTAVGFFRTVSALSTAPAWKSGKGNLLGTRCQEGTSHHCHEATQPTAVGWVLQKLAWSHED